MPRYYFDVRDGDGTFVDDSGMELPDMQLAIREARRALADMVRDALRDYDEHSVSILIRDGANGPVLITVTLSTELPDA
jgi:cobalamin biosynthesis protein CbiD